MVEEDPDLGSFLSAELRENHFVVDVACHPEQAMEALRGKAWYDLLILDLNTEQTVSTALIHCLRPNLPRLPVLVLTARNSVEDKVRAFEAGADDCLSKPLALSEFLARARALVRRNSGAVPNCSQVGDLSLYREERKVERNGRRIDLTPREFALLDVMMRNAGKPVSRATLLNEVWNLPGQPSTNIVRRVHEVRSRQSGFARRTSPDSHCPRLRLRTPGSITFADEKMIAIERKSGESAEKFQNALCKHAAFLFAFSRFLRAVDGLSFRLDMELAAGLNEPSPRGSLQRWI